MNQLIGIACGGLAMMVASIAHAQDRGTPPPDGGYTFGAEPHARGVTPPGAPELPLFHFGGLDVGVWAPMEPHYNANGDLDPAAEPFWGGHGFPGAAAFHTVDPTRAASISTPAQSSLAVPRE